MFKEAFSAVAIVLTFLLFAGYIRLILAGSIKPHVFSWIVWGVSTVTVFFAQLAGNAGVGAWPIGISGLMTFSIAILSYVKRGDTQITPTDWGFFVAALSAIPAWYSTSDPLWAVVILTLADYGTIPGSRRSWLLDRCSGDLGSKAHTVAISGTVSVAYAGALTANGACHD